MNSPTLRRLAPAFMYIAGAIYLVFAAYLIILALDAYQNMGDLIAILTPYFAYLVYLIPVALALGFAGWYFGGKSYPSANLFMTIGSATLLAGFFIFWAVYGAYLEDLLALWIYWFPATITLILGAYNLTGKTGLVTPPPTLETLIEKHRRTIRPIAAAEFHSGFRALRPMSAEIEPRRRTLRRI